MKTYIITGGSVDIDFIRSIIEADPGCVIAADRGLEACVALSIKPQYVIGDFDSVSAQTKSFFDSWDGEVTRLNPIKDDTDTEAALQLAFEKTEGDIVILGGTGSRLDHVLANISILGQGFEHGREVLLLDAHNRIRLIQKECFIKRDEQFGKFVSLFPINGSVRGVTLEGFYYPLTNATMEGYTSLGVSNEIVEKEARIKIDQGTLIMIESRD